MEYKYLFMPIKIGSITVNNRIAFAPHGTSFAKDNILDDRYVEYMKMRAEGGVGLIIAGGMTIAPSTKGGRAGQYCNESFRQVGVRRYYKIPCKTNGDIGSKDSYRC